MIIVARIGQSEESPYRGTKGLSRALQDGVDIVELSIRVTHDNAVILAWSPHLGNDKTEPHIRTSTLKELRRHTAGSKQPVILLSDALKHTFGSIMVAIDVHEWAAVLPLLNDLKPYIKRKKDWDNVLFCSSNPLILRKIRRSAPNAQLGLIHGRHTPLVFLAWPTLHLSTVLIHRLSVSELVVEAAHKLDYLVCAYTVDRPKSMARLEDIGVDAIITNYPEKFA